MAGAGDEEEASSEAAVEAARPESRKSLDAAIESANQEATRRRVPVPRLTRADFAKWVADYAPFGILRGDRRVFEEDLAKGVLGQPYSLEVVSDPPSIELVWQRGRAKGSMPILTPEGLALFTSFARESCTGEWSCDEDYRGPIPSKGLPFPAGVAVRIEEASAPGSCMAVKSCNGSTLAIELEVQESTVDSVADYFGQGFARSEVEARLRASLGRGATWLSLASVLPGWVGQRVGTFPGEGDNDVCHGPARQFFSPELRNGGFDRSTETVAILLKDHYCPIDDSEAPSFGDYLYISGAHSGRYVMTDPVSKRGIAFSIQSGGFPAYRFWWVDEDFSGKPFDRKPARDWRTRLVDVWRRCR